MKSYIKIVICLACWLGYTNVSAQWDCYIYGSVSLNVLENMCTGQWDLRASPTNYYGHSPYCSYYCYQYDLFKDGNHISQALVGSAPYTFHVNSDQPGNYSMKITTIYMSDVNACGNEYNPYTIAIDNTNQVAVGDFCQPSITYSNVSSAAGTLPLTSRTRDYLHTSNTVTVSASTNVVFYSQGEVSLLPGFSTENSANFQAMIAACSSTASSCSFRMASSDASPTVKWPSESVTSLDLYPNPATNTVHLSTGNYSNAMGSIEVFDMMGKKVMTVEQDSPIQNAYDIDTRQLSGLYLIKISSADQNTSTLKFLAKGSN